MVYEVQFLEQTSTEKNPWNGLLVSKIPWGIVDLARTISGALFGIESVSWPSGTPNLYYYS